VERLEGIADESDSSRVVPVILDGENPWEYYPDNGVHFVPALYRALLQSNKLHLTTFSQCLDDGVPVEHLEALVAGSWVYGDFGTWIGDPDKNRAWDLLCDAKSEFDDRYPHINDPAHQALTRCASSPYAKAPTGSGGSVTTIRRTPWLNLIACIGATWRPCMSCWRSPSTRA